MNKRGKITLLSLAIILILSIIFLSIISPGGESIGTIGDASKIPIWSVQFTGNESILYSLESLDNNQICIMPNDKDLKDIQVQDDILSSSITYKYPTTLKQYTGITEDSKSLVTTKDLSKDKNTDGSICYTLDKNADSYYIGESTIIIIKINNAEHLDENRIFIENIYPLVNSRDYIYASIPDKHYVRVTFESNLTSENDITIYAKSDSSADVQVYEKDSDILLADFGAIKDDGMYKIFLTNLTASQDTFDLKVSGGSINFDYIVDPTSYTWQRDALINASLPDIGSYSAPDVFYKDGTWYMIAGENAGKFFGFDWNGTGWTANASINASLPDIGDTSASSIFYKDSTWYMLAGDSLGLFNGFNWTGSAWQRDKFINASLFDIGSNSAPSVFYKDSTWYMISGTSIGNFSGFNWTGTAWQIDPNINASLPTLGTTSSNPRVFYKDSTWYMIAGGQDGLFYGFNWTGSAWQTDALINASLPDIGTRAKPSIFQKDGTWYMIAGENSGIFRGFNWTGDLNPPTYNSSQTNNTNAGQSTNFSLYVNDDLALNPNGKYVFSTNNTGTWINDTPVNFTATPQWANVTKTLNTTGSLLVSYRWYLNDSAGNNNNTGVYNITTIGGADTTSPTYNSTQTNNTKFGGSTNFSIYVNDETALNPNGQYIFSTNNSGVWVNESVVNFTTTPQWANTTKLLNSSFGTLIGYKWYLTDNAINHNNTGNYSLTITKNTDDCGVVFNTTSPKVYPYSFKVWSNCTTTFILYRNGSVISNNSDQNLKAGAYNFSVFRIDNVNYSNVYEARQFNINQVASVPYLKLNDTAGNLNTIYPSQVNASGSCDYGTATLTRNSTDVTTQNNIFVSLKAQYYLYNVACSGDENHSSASLDRYATINKSNISGLISGTSPLIYGNIGNVQGSETNNGDGDVNYTLYRNSTNVSNPDALILGVSLYIYVYNATEGENYTANSSIGTLNLTINKNATDCMIAYNTTSPKVYPYAFKVWSNCTSAINIYRNGSAISNNSDQSLGVGAYNFSVFRIDTQNYSNVYNESQFNINKGTLSGLLSSTKGWVYDYDNTATIISYAESNGGDGDVIYKIYRDSVDKGSGETINLQIGNYAYVLNSTGGANYSANNNINSQTLTININAESCGVLFNVSSPLNYSNVFNVWTNCTTAFTLYKNLTSITNNTPQYLGVGLWNFSVFRTDNINYSIITEQRNFTINKAYPTALLTNNLAWTRLYDGTNSTINISESNSGDSDVNYTLYRDNFYVEAPDNISAIGTYAYKINTTGGENYSSADNIDSNILIISSIIITAINGGGGGQMLNISYVAIKKELAKKPNMFWITIFIIILIILSIWTDLKRKKLNNLADKIEKRLNEKRK